MSKNLVFQVDIKDFDYSKTDFWRHYYRHEKVYSDSKKAAMRYAKRVNSDYICLTSNMLPDNYAPNYQKLSFFYFFERLNYDKIFVLDADAIVYDVCPNIFDFESVSGTTNKPNEDDIHWPILRDMCKFPKDSTPISLNALEGQELPVDYDKYFCSGTVMFTRDFYEATKDHWYSELEYCNSRNATNFKEQTVLNKLVWKHYPLDKVNILSEDWGGWWKDNKYINHITGNRKYNYEETNFSS